MLLNHSLALLDGKTGEREHTNLSGNVRPVTLDSLSLEGSAKSCSHVIHSLADDDELIEPLLAHSWVVEDGASNSSTMLGRGRVVGTDDDLDLGEDTAGSGLVSADEVEAASTLTIETHDLGKGLSNDHFEALVEEKAETIGILIKVTGGEALISGIEEGVKLAALADVSNLLPLGVCWVNTGGVVGTSVEKDDGSSSSSF